MALPTLTLPSIRYLRACFDYNPATGELRWKQRPRNHFPREREWKRWNARFAGTIAGYKQRHLRISLAQKIYSAHRIVWKLNTGKEPPPNIDHKNGNGLDNRWDNLREADQTKQNWNKKLQRNNSSGHRGVGREGSKWRASITKDGSQQYLGSFNTAQEAAGAYDMAARNLHGDFYRSCK